MSRSDGWNEYRATRMRLRSSPGAPPITTPARLPDLAAWQSFAGLSTSGANLPAASDAVVVPDCADPSDGASAQTVDEPTSPGVRPSAGGRLDDVPVGTRRPHLLGLLGTEPDWDDPRDNRPQLTRCPGPMRLPIRADHTPADADPLFGAAREAGQPHTRE